MIKIEECPNLQVLRVHTDFNIHNIKGLKHIIESIEGVETIDTFDVHKYNFIVSFGVLFSPVDIRAGIQNVFEMQIKP